MFRELAIILIAIAVIIVIDVVIIAVAVVAVAVAVVEFEIRELPHDISSYITFAMEESIKVRNDPPHPYRIEEISRGNKVPSKLKKTNQIAFG